MPRFRYRGFDAAGGRVDGTVDAERLEAARVDLQGRGLLLQELAPVELGDWRSSLGLVSDGVSLAELEFLTAELSLLLESGVRIDRGVAILQRASTRPATSRLLTALSGDLKQGRQFSEAAAAHPDVFDPLYVNLIALGEASGRLPDVFKGLAEDLRFRRDLRQKILQASTYPLVVLGVCVLALVFIFNFVVPNLGTLFADAKELPWYTTLLLDSSAFVRSYQWFLLAALGAAGAAIWQSRTKPWVRDLRDRLLTGMPGVRDANVMVERIRFSGGLALMLEAGLAVDRALVLATGNVRHDVIRREVAIAVDKVRRGEQLSVVLRQTRLFPDFYASLVEVGEESGELARVFGEIARRSRDAFSAWAQRLTTMLEPLLILVMGLIVGAVVVVMMLSITSVTDVGL